MDATVSVGWGMPPEQGDRTVVALADYKARIQERNTAEAAGVPLPGLAFDVRPERPASPVAQIDRPAPAPTAACASHLAEGAEMLRRLQHAESFRHRWRSFPTGTSAFDLQGLHKRLLDTLKEAEVLAMQLADAVTDLPAPAPRLTGPKS